MRRKPDSLTTSRALNSNAHRPLFKGMKLAQLPLKCACGKFAGTFNSNVEPTSIRAICYCDDCQAYAHHLGRAREVLDTQGGTDIVGTRPSFLKVTSGQDLIACVRLTPKGLFRFYASCCHSPIANSPSIVLPYAGVVRTCIALTDAELNEAVGPVRFRMQAKSATSEPMAGSSLGVPPRLMLATIKFVIVGKLKGLAKPTPFFKENGEPVHAPRILSPAEREHLRQFCGPKASH